MLGHWFIVASQKTVTIFTEVSERNRLQQIKVFENPLGRERSRALIKKEAGHGTKSIGRTGSVYYTEVKRHDPHEDAAIQFAKEIAHFLKSEYTKKKFNSLTVVAEPRFLGKIRSAMEPVVQATVIDWIKKDLQKIPQKKLAHFLLPTNTSTESLNV